MKFRWNGPSEEEGIGLFWKWFASEGRNMDPFDQSFQQILSGRLKRINRELAWGASKGTDGEPSRLEISAGGIAALIPSVEAIVAQAPDIPGWEIVAFRQPTDAFTLLINSTSIGFDSIFWAELGSSGGQIDLALYVPLPDNTSRQHVGFVMLDHALGEYVVMTRVGQLDFLDYALAPGNVRPLTELRARVENLNNPKDL